MQFNLTYETPVELIWNEVVLYKSYVTKIPPNGILKRQ
jgi:hypothetical protein